jgi:hypothetical protein
VSGISDFGSGGTKPESGSVDRGEAKEDEEEDAVGVVVAVVLVVGVAAAAKLDLRPCRGEEGSDSCAGEPGVGTPRESAGSLQSSEDLARRMDLEEPLVFPGRGDEGVAGKKLLSLPLFRNSKEAASGVVGEAEGDGEGTEDEDGDSETDSASESGGAMRTGGTFSMMRRDACFTSATWTDESESERKKGGGGSVGESHVPSSSLADMDSLERENKRKENNCFSSNRRDKRRSGLLLLPTKKDTFGGPCSTHIAKGTDCTSEWNRACVSVRATCTRHTTSNRRRNTAREGQSRGGEKSTDGC